MRSVHLLGVGLVIGSVALGAMLAVMSYRWQAEAFPEQGPLAAAHEATAGSQPQLTGNATRGKTTFDAKCAGCHTIGGGKRSGPDLKGVTAQRPHDWLIEFIVAPDKVIAGGDPVAKQLVQEYGMPMPNVGVSRADAEDVLAYIAGQGGEATAPAAPAPAKAALPAAAATPAPAPAAAAPAPAAAPPAKPAAPVAAQASSQGQTLFTQKCASCHSVGGGRLAGPDLKGVTAQRPRDWLVRMIVEPDKLIASGDATAKQLVQEYGMPMPNLGVPSADAGAILDYLDAQSGAGGQAAPAGAAAAAPLPLGDPQVGRALFNGERPLASGGPACMGCHNAAGAGALGGGNWGLDLTNSQTRTGTAGLVSIMRAPPFPGMTEAFAARPLTDGEVSDLAALFVEMDAQPAPSTDYLFPLIGLGAFAILLALTQLVWRGRARGVRRQLVQGGRR